MECVEVGKEIASRDRPEYCIMPHKIPLPKLCVWHLIFKLVVDL
jgi:hypothetical protein